MKYALAEASRSSAVSGIIDREHSGQKAASAGTTVSQRGHVVSVCADVGGLNEAPSIAFLAAIFTDAVNLEGMSSRHVTMFAANLLFELTDFRREELHRRSALGTHHVVMTAPVVLMFIAGDAVVKGHFAGQSAVGKQLERPVDGRESDVRIFFLDELREFVGRKMFASLEERAQNRAALLGLLQADTAQMAQKDILGLAHVLRRDTRLIVNSFLQHVGFEWAPRNLPQHGSKS